MTSKEKRVYKIELKRFMDMQTVSYLDQYLELKQAIFDYWYYGSGIDTIKDLFYADEKCNRISEFFMNKFVVYENITEAEYVWEEEIATIKKNLNCINVFDKEVFNEYKNIIQ
ncbi:hypothetical protein [Helicobacter sp. 13S00477-4]|uniref:hypothetical protein n=1 Tax=Helicobacter sp. 13S00477-4 TaxID=1905759 RepID=UPI000BA75D0A|nr:hypothetical protein [Helicobacter sp. 13S00477-4]PAF51271.1 hypothetical protein BKH44_06075 [Helicobacter sp. 13S00477-4]